MRRDRFSDDWFEHKLGLFCGGGGDGDGDGGDPSNPGNIGVGSGASLGATSNANFSGGRDDGDSDSDDSNNDVGSRDAIANAAGVSRDTIVGSGPGGRNAVTSRDGSPVTSGRAVQEEANRQGTTVEDITSRISNAASNLGQGPSISSSLDTGFQDNTAFAVPNFAPNVTPPGSVPGSYSRNMVSAIEEVQARNALRGITDITSGLQTGTESRDTRINPMDPFAGESLMTPDERARSNAELLASIGQTADLGPSISAAVASPTISAPSPYEQLIGAPELQTSMGAPPESTQFGEVDIPYLPSSIDVFGLEIPTGVGLIEGVLNSIFDPTGTTQQAVYDKGVRSIDGQPTGNETGLDILTGDGNVIGAYDPESNIVYSTEGNRFNDRLSDFYNQQREIEDAERDRNGDDREPILVEPTNIEEEDVAVDEEYQGQPISGLFPTTNLPTENRDLTQYTEVGDINPFVLRPFGMKDGGIVEAARFKTGGMVQRYQDGGSVDAATQRLADIVYQQMTSGVIQDQGLDDSVKAPSFSSSKERNEFLRKAGYNPGDLQNFYGSTGGPKNEISKALYERYTGSNRPAGRSNIADLAYLQSQGFDVSKNMDRYDPAVRKVFDMAVENPNAGYDLTRQYAETGKVPTQNTGIGALQSQFDALQQQYNDLLARFNEEQRQQSLMQGMGSGTFGESSAGYTGAGINMGTGPGTFAETRPAYTQLDPGMGLSSGFMGNTQPAYLTPLTPETNFLADPFSTATNVGYVPPPVYYPFAYQVPGQQQ